MFDYSEAHDWRYLGNKIVVLSLDESMYDLKDI